MKIITLILLVSIFLFGCASLMFKTIDYNKELSNLTLHSGDSIYIKTISIKDNLSIENKNIFIENIQKSIINDLQNKNINIDKNSKNYITIEIINFDKGQSISRALGNPFGIGMSKLEANTTININGKTRELNIRKVGNKSGLSEMDDQTEENIQYLTKSLVNKICK